MQFLFTAAAAVRHIILYTDLRIPRVVGNETVFHKEVCLFWSCPYPSWTMSKQRPEKWYSISEESYCAFCSSANAQEKMTILQTASQLNSILCASQRKVVEELFYRALIYSMQNQFTYSTLQIFLMVMQVELEHLLDVPCGQRDAPSPLLRFQDTVSAPICFTPTRLFFLLFINVWSFHPDSLTVCGCCATRGDYQEIVDLPHGQYLEILSGLPVSFPRVSRRGWSSYPRGHTHTGNAFAIKRWGPIRE